MERRIEVVKNNGNLKTRFTINPERLTVKLTEEDLPNETDLVNLGLKMAEQIDYEGTLRGTRAGGTRPIKLSTNHFGLTYIFDRESGDLIRVRKGQTHEQ